MKERNLHYIFNLLPLGFDLAISSFSVKMALNWPLRPILGPIRGWIELFPQLAHWMLGNIKHFCYIYFSVMSLKGFLIWYSHSIKKKKHKMTLFRPILWFKKIFLYIQYLITSLQRYWHMFIIIFCRNKTSKIWPPLKLKWSLDLGVCRTTLPSLWLSRTTLLWLCSLSTKPPWSG